MGYDISEGIRQLDAMPPDEVLRMKWGLEYALVMGLDAAIADACFKLDLTVIQKEVTGFFSKTMYLKVEGKASDLARFLRWLLTQVDE